MRYRIAFYGSTPSYWPVLKHHNMEDLGLKLNKMSKAGQWDLMANEISDDLVHLFSAVGRYDEISKEISNRFQGVADAIYASTSPDMPSAMSRDLITDIKRIPIAFKGFTKYW